MNNSSQTMLSTISNSKKQTQKEPKMNTSRPKIPTRANTKSFINSDWSFGNKNNGSFGNISQRETDTLASALLQPKFGVNSSVSIDAAKPSRVCGFSFSSSTNQGRGYQSYSSNLVRQRNLKKEVQDYKEKKKLDASIRRWNCKVDEDSGSLEKKEDTPIEKQDDFQYDDNPDVSSLTMLGSMSHMKLFNKTFGNVETPKYDPEKEKYLAKLVKSWLKNGYTVAQMARDPVFENVLDICCNKGCFSSVDYSDEDISLDNWMALRKCRYLRVSQRNIVSLKEATLKALQEK